MKNLIIADIRSNNYNGICTGHYIAIAKMYKDLYNDSSRVTIAGGPIYNNYFEEKDLLKLPFDICPKDDRLLIRIIKTLINCWKLYRKVPKGSVIVLQQCSDVPSHIFSSIFYKGGSKLYMIRYNDNGVSNSVKKIIYSFVKKKIDGIICPNNRVGDSYQVPYIIVPDYIYTGDPSFQAKKYNDRLYDFCIVGRLNQDKGCLESIMSLANSRYKVLVAGKAENDSYAEKLQQACKNSNNIELHLGYISDDDYNEYISNSRYCLLNYQGEYSSRSSGVVYDTIFRGTPVIGNKCSALDFIEDYNVGQLTESIKSFDYSSVLNETIYSKFLENIVKYRHEHRLHKETLSIFLTLNTKYGG